MSVSLEKIDMLMERANISYKEAKDALEKFDGDMVEALIYLEGEKKTGQIAYSKSQKNYKHKRCNQSGEDFGKNVKKFFEKMHKTSFIIGKKGKRVLDIPLTIAAILILLAFPVSLFILIIPYLFGYKIVILDPKGAKVNLEDAFKCDDEASNENEPEDRQF